MPLMGSRCASSWIYRQTGPATIWSNLLFIWSEFQAKITMPCSAMQRECHGRRTLIGGKDMTYGPGYVLHNNISCSNRHLWTKARFCYAYSFYAAFWPSHLSLVFIWVIACVIAASRSNKDNEACLFQEVQKKKSGICLLGFIFLIPQLYWLA